MSSQIDNLLDETRQFPPSDNDVISPGGLNWDDHINLPEAGNYTLRMVVCFDGAACLAQTGTWHTLSNEIPVTISQK